MCVSRRLSHLVILWVTLECSATKNVFNLEGNEPALFDGDTKSLNRNGCSSKEEYFDCRLSPACQRTCSNLNGACLPDASCVPGCFCRSGFARDDFTKECIPIKQCPGTSCPRNEFFNTCETRSECERTCAEKNTPCNPAIPCTTGCQCKSGFFRDPISKKCIRERDCSRPPQDQPKCPNNEHFEGCGSSCKETCPGNQNCEIECKSGCFCDAGLVRIKGRCFEPSKCFKNSTNGENPICGPRACSGETDPDCQEACICPLNCANGEKSACSFPCAEDCNQNACTAENTIQCDYRCFCSPGEKRIGGVCRPQEECPLICPSDQEEKTILPCSESCDPDECSNNPSQAEVKMCACKAGLKRHPDGTCVAECPTCPEGEVFALSTECEENCDGFACNNQDRTPTYRCSCKNGQKRQFVPEWTPEVRGECVDQNECTCVDPYARYDCLNLCHNDCQSTHVECEDNAKNIGCVHSCYCVDNQRLVDGICQPFSDCRCGENAIFSESMNRCLESCDSAICDSSLPTGPGCYCKTDFARIGNDCLSRDSCPPRPPVLN